MKIKVCAPGFCSLKYIDNNGFMELDENSTVKDVFKKLEVPVILRFILVYSVNYNKVDLNTVLKNGDILSFLPLLAGG